MTRQRILSIAMKIFAGSFVLLLASFIIPKKFIMPVEGATRKRQGKRKMFYLNPITYLNKTFM
jgi:hypothetical protein